MNEKIKTLSLFAGIGGIDLGLEATGYFETVQFVEYDPYCQHILKRHWPDVPIWGDVKTFDPDSCGEIDCIVGGYPCQPFSVAGKQKGTQDDRHLWPRMFEIIKHKRPSLILCENVSGHIVLGLDEVLLDLEGEGYSTRAFVIPASAVDANHKRERVWIVAYSRCFSEGSKKKSKWASGNTSRCSSRTHARSKSLYEKTNVANTDSEARGNTKGSGEAKRELQPQEQEGSTMGSEVTGCGGLRGESEGSIERRLGGVVDGVPSWLDEPDIPRVTTNQTGRVQRLKMLGNAVVPQVVYQLGLAMKELWDEV